MTNRELERLKDSPVPPPDAASRAAALTAALAAYDAAQDNSSAGPQGGDAPARPTHMTSNSPWRRMMRTQTSTIAIAASIAVAFVAVPVAFRHLSSGQRVLGPLSGERREATAPRADANQPRPSTVKPAEPKPGRVALGKDGEQPSSTDAVSTATSRSVVSVDAQTSQQADEKRKIMAGMPARQALERDRGIVAAPPSPPVGLSGGGLMGAAKPERNAIGFADVTDTMPAPQAEEGRDRFEHVSANPVKPVAREPVSTFSVDVDTASYAFVRRALNSGRLPPKDAVRIEELINYFSYDYPRPETASEPFKPTVTVVASPWSSANKLVHVAIKGYELAASERPPANLVLLIDVSGSMQPDDRLPLLKNAFKMLLDRLRPDDTVGIVTYASGSGVALEPTKVADKGKIIAAIDRLGAGGSTAGARGIEDAYRLAEASFRKDGVNRVILGTDGDFNVGITNQEELKSYIERQRKSGVYLSILGVGRGNYNDALMQALAQNGNGTAAYIDTLNEARKVLVEEASSTLFPIAKDVKIQLEFNPAVVSEYRLIGYETRALRREDFNNDKIDAGDVGSGHAVTALYEITPAAANTRSVDELRYGLPEAAKPAPSSEAAVDEIGFLKLRYKLPAEETSRLLTTPIRVKDEIARIEAASTDVRFGVAVAAFGQLLKGGEWTGSYHYDDAIALASGAKGDDPFGLRAEFVNLIRLAKSAQP